MGSQSRANSSQGPEYENLTQVEPTGYSSLNEAKPVLLKETARDQVVWSTNKADLK